jgi:thiol-disulfide isomerase/thioredoxin
LAVLLCASALSLFGSAQSCESSAAVQAADRALDKKIEGATFAESNTLKDAAYQQMMQLDPSDFRPVRDYLQHIYEDEPEQWEAVREKTAAEANAHPQDPLKVLAAALVLRRKDTPQAFRLAEQAAAAQPDYAPVYVQLARMYATSGKYTDKDKAGTEVEKFYALCPASLDGWGFRYLNQLGSKELKVKVANNLRRRLATASDPHVLESYGEVWSLEFSVLPVPEHAKERERVAEDLKRLQALPVHADAEWLSFLKDGYKQSGAPEGQVKAIEARIAREFPQSDEAFSIWYHNWEDEHPRPAGEASRAEWQQYMRPAIEHYQLIAKLFPKQHGSGYWLFEYTTQLDGVSNEEIARAAEAFIKDMDYFGPESWSRQEAATALLDHNVEPARALALLDEERRLKESAREKLASEIPDYAKKKEVDDAAQQKATQDAEFNLVYLRAYRATGEKKAAEALKANMESAPPTYPQAVPAYWNARAILAEMEGRNTDALAFYQKALFLREPPKKRFGEVNDVLMADARRLWTAAQGSDDAFAIWSKPDNSTKSELAEGRWEKPEKDLPAFELADLQGKTWKLTQLEGKKVLINIWATWCGPCQLELPHLEKLYEQTKNRSDIAILTLNFDEDLGMVEPFVKKKGFTFPVLPAYTLLANKIDVNSIPRNWLVNANGKWEWEQIGFDAGEADWEAGMLARLEGTK